MPAGGVLNLNEESKLLSSEKNQTHSLKSSPLKLVALIAGILFTFAMDKKTPEQIAIPALMLSATVFPVLSDLYADCRGLSDAKHQAIETVSSGFMTAAVALMQMGATQELGKSTAADVGFSGIVCFSAFALTNMFCNVAKLFQMLVNKNNDETSQSTPVFPRLTLFSNGSGLIGSVLFFITQIMGYYAARENNNESQKKVAEVLALASFCFIAVTGYNTYLTTQSFFKARNEHLEARVNDTASSRESASSEYGA